MDKFVEYFNSLNQEEKHRFASSCGTSVGYIRKIISSKNRLFFGPKLCRKFQKESGNQIDPRELRPNDWKDHWPELAA